MDRTGNVVGVAGVAEEGGGQVLFVEFEET